MLFKNLNATVTELDPLKGITKGYLSNWDNVDSDGDFTVKGKTFVKTVTESGPSGAGTIQHLLNHTWSTPAGVFQNVYEDQKGLAYESQLMKNKAGVFTPRSEEIIACYDTGYKFNHSYGYKILNKQKTAQGNMLSELRLFEGSTLYGPGANSQTPMTGMKSAGYGTDLIEDLDELLEIYEKMLHRGNYQDTTYQSILLKHEAISAILKAKAPTEPPAGTQPEAVDYSAFADRFKAKFSIS